MGKKRLAQVWDKMQFLFRNFYDRTMHCVQIYDGKIDTKVLGDVLMWMVGKAPILHSTFKYNPIRPYWVENEFTLNDFYKVNLDCKNLDEEIDKAVTQSADHNWKVQIRFTVLSDGNKYAMIMISNHMCMDGGDFKYFMKMIAENYAKALDGRNDFELKDGDRSLEQVYSGLSKEDAKKAKKLFYNISNVKDTHVFPLTKPSAEDKTIMVKRPINAETFAKLRAKSKEKGYTINDVMLAFYIRSLYSVGNYKENEMLAIPCMVDLRRHILDNAAHTGLTNHTGFMICKVDHEGKDLNETLLLVANAMKPNKEDKFLGLYGLPKMNLVYKIFPQFITEKLVLARYDNPLIGMSNVGVMDQKSLKMGDANLCGGFMTGAVKYKPYMQLAFTTCAGSMLMTIAVRGNKEDEKIINKFFDYFEENIAEFLEK